MVYMAQQKPLVTEVRELLYSAYFICVAFLLYCTTSSYTVSYISLTAVFNLYLHIPYTLVARYTYIFIHI